MKNQNRIIHPKEIFERELEARNETVETLADKTGIFWGIWEQVLTGARIDNDLAIALEKTWGTSAQTWLNLWENYMEQI
jgi:plasmid maintenance system antidote protein VapI